MILIQRSIRFALLLTICLLLLASAQAQSCVSNTSGYIEIDTLDKVVNAIGGFCGAFLSFFLILGFIIYTPLRRQPGDLIFVRSLADFTLSIFWIISAFRGGENVADPSIYCKFSAIVSTFAGTITVTYSFSFCYYLLSVLKNSLKHSQVPSASLHIVPITLSLAYLIYVSIQNFGSFGVTSYGTCSTNVSRTTTPWGGAVLILAYVILAVVTQRYVKHFTPDCDRISSVKKDFLVFYTGLLTATSILWSIIFVATVLINLEEVGTIEGCWVSDYFHPILTIAKASSPLVLMFFRYRDKFVGKYMSKLFFCFDKRGRSSTLRIPLKEAQSSNETEIAIEMAEYSRESRSMSDMAAFKSEVPRRYTMEEVQGIEVLAKNLRFQIIYTMLCGIVCTDKLIKEKHLPKIQINPEEQHVVTGGKVLKIQRKKTDIFKNFDRYLLNNQIIQEELPEYYAKMQHLKYEVLEGDMTCYCENIFSELRAQDQEFLDIQESLDAAYNEEKVRKAGEGRGGKSGEFFFFSYDNKLIIKTMTTDELRVLLDVLARYHKHHIHDNPKSLLAKIYGVFTFQRDNDPDPVHLIMMRNCNGWPGNCVVRKYDLKGSTFARKVEKRKNASKEMLKPEETYKDIDFLNYDQSFFITEELRPVILEVIRKDAQFLKGCGIIDYSLAVYMINKSLATKKRGDLNRQSSDMEGSGMTSSIEHRESKSRFKKPKAEEFNELYSMQSQEEPHICYNMGIIDYLQLYTFQKRTEKFLKKVLNCNSKLDTSSSDPERYFTRFIQFAEKVFASKKTENDTRTE